MLLSDYSVQLMKLGKHKEALEILAVIYNHYPNEYKVAANLGTAYELNGMPDSALKYIKRGIELNPNSHEGSEWVHVKVLETKLKLKTDPNYLKNNSVLGLTEKQKMDSLIRRQIEIQVRERFPFIAGPDEIMASLLIDLGDCYANTASIEFAKVLYEIAKEYYGSTSPAIDVKIAEMKKLLKEYSTRYIPRKPLEETELASKVRVGKMNYKNLIQDNDPDNYTIDWGKINTNVVALLKFADLTKPVEEVYNSAIKDSIKTDEELKFINDKKDSLSAVKKVSENETQNTSKSNYWIYGALLLIIPAGLYLAIKMKSKNPKK
jgi:tetratricopeptide (TPR) repeat protein